MRAIEVTGYGGTEGMELTERDEPSAEAGQLVIEVAAAGINFADIQQRMGIYPGGPEPPFVPGFEVSGEVVRVGDDCDFEVGDRVVGICNIGGYAEYAVADETTVVSIPDGLETVDAAAIPVQFLTAHGCLFDRGGLEAGERVLIHAAAGGVGSAAVQLASAAGAEVFGTASTQEKLDLAADLGCDHPINYEESDFAEEIEDITDGGGVDLVIDGVGGDAFRDSFDILNHFGRIVTFGVASADPASAQTTKLLFSNQDVLGFHLGNTISRDPERALAPLEELLTRVAEGELSVTIGGRYDLESAAEAHKLIESRQSRGKILLEP